jgi:hypothetical protein
MPKTLLNCPVAVMLPLFIRLKGLLIPNVSAKIPPFSGSSVSPLPLVTKLPLLTMLRGLPSPRVSPEMPRA